MTTATPPARYGAMGKARVASGYATADELHHAPGHDRFSKVETARVLAEHRALSLPEAKSAIHESEAWSDVRSRDEQFHETLVAAVEGPEAKPDRAP